MDVPVFVPGADTVGQCLMLLDVSPLVRKCFRKIEED